MPARHFTILDRNILDSCESWLFSWFFNPFQMFCHFKHTTSAIWQSNDNNLGHYNTIFSTSFVQNHKNAGKLVFAKIHLFATASTLVAIILFFSLKLGQISFKHTYSISNCVIRFQIVLFHLKLCYSISNCVIPFQIVLFYSKLCFSISNCVILFQIDIRFKRT